MGNNNSASSANSTQHSQWSHPDPHSDIRVGMDDGKNRMRRGYNPPKKYMGHLGPPPQKVLPAVNPTKAAKKLKPTSNGLNLKQCGTISGRKLNEIELDLSPSRTTIVDVVDGRNRRGPEQRYAGRLNGSAIPGLVRQNGMSSPNLLDECDRMKFGGFEPLQNSRNNRGNGRGFHESEPELRQGHHSQDRPTALGFPTHLLLPPQPASYIQDPGPAKKQIRSKKKKTAPPPPLISSKKSNSFRQQPPKSQTPPLVQEITKVHQRMFKTKAEGRLSSSSVDTKPHNGRYPGQSGSSIRTDSRNSSTSTSVTPGKENGRGRSNPKQMTRNTSPDYPPAKPSHERNGKVEKKQRGQQTPLEIVPVEKHYLPYSSVIDSEVNRGMKKSLAINNEIAENLSSGKTGPKKTSEKRSFYFGMDDFEPKLPHNRRNLGKVEKNNVVPSAREPITKYKDESPSDNASTSSEMDIVLRPTLPPKRTELPKFSPSAAWNRIDLDSPNSSEEEALRFNHPTRKSEHSKATPPGVTETNPGEGDSGISGLDGDGGGSPEILSPPGLPVVQQPLTSKGKCWTPEQDLDESSSEFEAEEEGIILNRHKGSAQIPPGPSDHARLTTRRNFFTNSSKSDTEGTMNKEINEPIYARSTKSKGRDSLITTTTATVPVEQTDEPPAETHPLEFKPSLNRIINYRRNVNKEVAGVGLDANWFLSRSEPNSLNLTHLMSGGDEAGRRGCGRDSDDHVVEIRSENGYAPTKLHFEPDEPPESGNSSNWNKSASLISLSHIVYLPQSHSGMDEAPGGGGKRNHHRRAKSVENLLNNNHNSSNPDRGAGNDKMKNQSPSHRQPANYNKRKKFKFQSTLKVLERKQIERELSREAEEKELERLREIEAMKRVEAEFQKKRKHREAEQEGRGGLPSGGLISNSHPPPPVMVTLRQWEDEEHVPASAVPSACSTPCQFSNKSTSNNSTRSSNLSKVHLTQRQDPEGAPSVQDLRKELIIGAKKRNGISSASSDLTQELSEYRQETRQYCDYRSSPRLNMDASSKARNKFVDSTSSDIYPLTGRIPLMDNKHHRPRPKSTVVYPEIVCDIPNKPFPYMVNFSSRLSGSHTSLLIEERPPSGIGYTSGPSSVISDNYRRDWAHHVGKPSGSSIANAGKSSSITSLHSTSDHPRLSNENSSVIDSPKIFHRVIGSRSSEIKEPENSFQTMNVLNESLVEKRGPSQMTSDACLQPQSFISYKTKSYRPVIFNPANSSSRP